MVGGFWLIWSIIVSPLPIVPRTLHDIPFVSKIGKILLPLQLSMEERLSYVIHVIASLVIAALPLLLVFRISKFQASQQVKGTQTTIHFPKTLHPYRYTRRYLHTCLITPDFYLPASKLTSQCQGIEK